MGIFDEDSKPGIILEENSCTKGHCCFQHIKDQGDQDKDDDSSKDPVFGNTSGLGDA